MANTIEQLRDVLVEKLSGIREIEISEDTLLRRELGFDSLRLVDLMVSIEECFNVEFNESDLDPAALIKVGDLVALIERTIVVKQGG